MKIADIEIARKNGTLEQLVATERTKENERAKKDAEEYERECGNGPVNVIELTDVDYVPAFSIDGIVENIENKSISFDYDNYERGVK